MIRTSNLHPFTYLLISKKKKKIPRATLILRPPVCSLHPKTGRCKSIILARRRLRIEDLKFNSNLDVE